jgi:hypothetical protein
MGLTQKLGTIPLAIFTDASNNVGIGVTPTTRLTIGRVDSSSEGAQIDLCRASDNTNAWGIDIFGNTSTPSFRILDNVAGAARMIIDGTVRVGFGLSPAYALDVANSSSPSLRVRNGALGGTSTLLLETANNFSGTCQTFIQCIGSVGNGTSQLAFGTAGASGDATATERMRITSLGNLLLTGGVSTGVTDTKFLMISQGTTSSTFAMVVKQSNNSTNLFLLRDDGAFNTGLAAVSPYNNTVGGSANLNVDSTGFLGRSTSSLKYKTDVKDYDKGLLKVMQLRPVYYKSKNKKESNIQFAGLIAEEVHDLGLTEFVQYAEDGTPDALSYQNMIALLTKAIQELKAEVDSLKQLVK